MMKMGSKYLPLVLVLAVLSTSAIAYAAYTLKSNIVSADLQYELTITKADVAGSSVVLSVKLVGSDGSTGLIGLVNFYRCNSGGGDRVWIGSDETNGGGDGGFIYDATSNGLYYFIATYDIPNYP